MSLTPTLLDHGPDISGMQGRRHEPIKVVCVEDLSVVLGVVEDAVAGEEGDVAIFERRSTEVGGVGIGAVDGRDD